MTGGVLAGHQNIYQSQSTSTICPQASAPNCVKKRHIWDQRSAARRQDGIKDTHQQPNQTIHMSAKDALPIAS